MWDIPTNKIETESGIIKTENTAKRVREDWYDWKVYLEGPQEALNEIREVEYLLHETFRNPVRRKTNAGDKFALETSGWGEFDIGVRVIFKDGTEKTMKHWLNLFSESK